MDKYRFISGILNYSRVFVLIALFIFFSMTTETFWSITSWDNIANIVFQQMPFLLLLTISSGLAILLNGIDLSIGSSVAMISCMVGLVLNKTYNAWLGIIIGIAMGLAVGLFMGFVIAKIKVSSFVTTYSMQWVLSGIALVLLAGKQIYDFGPDFRPMFITHRWTFLVIAMGVLILMIFLASKTRYGRAIYAIGKNPEAAKLSGINTDKVIIITYMLSGAIMGLASVLYIANLGSAEPVIGGDFPMRGMAAALVGGISFGGGRGRIVDTLVGSMIMLILTNGMIQIGVPSVWQDFITGLVIVMAVFLERGIEKMNMKIKIKESREFKAVSQG